MVGVRQRSRACPALAVSQNQFLLAPHPVIASQRAVLLPLAAHWVHVWLYFPVVPALILFRFLPLLSFTLLLLMGGVHMAKETCLFFDNGWGGAQPDPHTKILVTSPVHSLLSIGVKWGNFKKIHP